MIKKICKICGKNFETKTNRTLYCGEECRKTGNREKQRELMKKKRDTKKDEKVKSLNPNKTKVKKVKKTVNMKQYYKKMKKEILANEAQFGYTGLTLIEGVDIHEENFIDLILQKIRSVT